ncbi:hypothetical protein BK652_17495 [Pseudomonas brassicacearum]|uniref:Uncharacterized protein n=2 Tax=Pseudomonas TaxID=286 RepID=A0A0G3GJV9_9PSED|nr:hypothetical protein VM99_27155 [Pseudomonas chlororaphis]ROM82283.1 hypothetical protein BK652_17495 [Pseudomonas brassicacearum]
MAIDRRGGNQASLLFIGLGSSLEPLRSCDRQGFTGCLIQVIEVHAQRVAEASPETVIRIVAWRMALELNIGRSLDQFRQQQVFYIETSGVQAPESAARSCNRIYQLIDVQGGTLLLIESFKWVQIQKRVIRDQPIARRQVAWFGNATSESADLPHPDLEIPHDVGISVLYPHRLAFGQGQATLAVDRTVGAEIGQAKRTFTKAHQCVLLGHHALAVRDDPVAVLTSAYDTSSRPESFPAMPYGARSAGVQHLENKFHL